MRSPRTNGDRALHGERDAVSCSGTEADQNSRKTAPLRGAGYAIVLEPPSGSAPRPAQWRYRAPPGGAPHPGSSGYEEGRRRIIGGVAALSINPHATTPMVRRWVAGTPMRHGGPEGRRRGHGPEPQQRPYPYPYPYPKPPRHRRQPGWLSLHHPKLPALSRKRPTNFNNPDWQAGSPPLQCPPNLV